MCTVFTDKMASSSTVVSLPFSRDNLLPIIGLGAAVSAALTYIVWGGGDSREEELRYRKVAGLENLGNTCYLNTILQSLAACPKFVRWLQRALQNSQFRGKREDLAYKLSKTLQVVNDFSCSHAGTRTFSPRDVLYALNNCNWKDGREQQDCHELFQFLVTELQVDSERLSSSVLLLSEAAQLEAKKNGFLHQSTLRSSIDAHLPQVCTRTDGLPFRGLIAHHLSCTACGHKNRVSYSQFDCLSLNMPYSAFGTSSLDQMLETFTQVELVDDVECSNCFKIMEAEVTSPKNVTEQNHVNGKSENVQSEPPSSPLPVCLRSFQKQMTLAKLPQCLCIHVQRVVWTPTGVPYRRGEHVMFPERLDMSSYRHITGVKRDRSLLNGLKGSSNFTRESKNGFIGERFLTSSDSFPVIGQTINSFQRINSHCHKNNEDYSNTGNSHRQISGSNVQYLLMSAVVHTGDATSGHFLTYRRALLSLDDPVSRTWLCISDENVTTATLTDVLSQKAYMLYYQRV